MKPNELRIGVIVYQGAQYGEKPITAYELTQYANMMSGGFVADYYIEWRPIPLTEEWLLKLGFKSETEFEHSKEYWYHDKMRTFAKERFYIYLPYGLFDSMAPCKYVHQLQNLYFALTGEELTIKSPEIINT